MSHTPHVTYYNINGEGEDKKQRVTGACFSRTQYGDKIPKTLLYECPIRKTLKEAEVEAWCELMAVMFGNAWTFKQDGSTINWTLDCKGITNKRQFLCYLSAPRYLDEFPEIVADYYAELKKLEKPTDEDKFRLMQEAHYPYDSCKKSLSYHNLGGLIIPVVGRKFGLAHIAEDEFLFHECLHLPQTHHSDWR